MILNFTANLPECIRKDYAQVCTQFCVMELNHSGKEIASLTCIYKPLLINTQQNYPCDNYILTQWGNYQEIGYFV